MTPAISITVITSPYHLGTRDVAVGKGPAALLRAGFIDALRKEDVTIHEVEIEPVDEVDGEIARHFELLRRTSKTVEQAIREDSFPIILSGNCSTTVGVHAGISAARGKVPGCVWFDAHDDFNTPDTLVSGYLDSMPVAMLAGLCWKTLLASIPGFRPLNLKRDFVQCGVRDVTELERSRVLDAGFPAVWGDVEKHVAFEKELRKIVQESQLGEIMVHVDLDCLDTSVGVANKFAAPGGLLEDDLIGCLAVLPTLKRPVSLTVASLDPSFDKDGKIPPVAIGGAVSFVKGLLAEGFLKSTL